MIKKLWCWIVGHKWRVHCELTDLAKKKQAKAYMDLLLYGQSEYKAESDDLKSIKILCDRCQRGKI